MVKIMLRICRKSHLNKILLILAFAGMSCAHKVIPDPSPSPIELGKGRVETVLCGRHAVGDNACWVNEGDDPEIEVRTYFDGILVLKSDKCGIDVKHTYKSHEPYKVKLSSLLKEPFDDFCFIDILLSPQYPDADKSEVPIQALSGRMVLVASVNERANLYGPGEIGDGILLVSMPESQIYNLLNEISINTYSDAGSIMIAGCGLEPRQQFYSDGLDPYRIPILAFFGGVAPRDVHCVFVGRVNPWDYDVFRDFVIPVEIYSDDLVSLADPLIRLGDDEIEFESYEPISWTILNGKEAINSGTGKFDIDSTIPNEIVQLTAQGRTKVIRIELGDIIWSK